MGTVLADQAAKTPEQIAVRFAGQQLSYAELIARANQLGHFLRAQGVQPDTLVGICIERSIDMVVAILGVLQSGAAYLPLDPSYPVDRLSYMLGTAKTAIVLTQASLLPLVEQVGGSAVKALVLSDLQTELQGLPSDAPTIATQPGHLAYVIYTSGSTGMPKGVAITHETVVNLMRWHQEGQGDHAVLARPAKMLQFSPLGFDASVPEIFGTLCTGGTLVLIPNELRLDTQSLLSFLREEGIERINVPFVALQALSQAASADPQKLWPKTLHTVVSAGEALIVTPDLARCFATVPGSVLFNQYGPTETTVMSTSYTMMGDPLQWPAQPSIGKPLSHIRIWLLDEALQPVKPGEEGELHVGGPCLAREYLHRPDLTEQRFIANPFVQDEPSAPVLYKTGDLLRLLPDGNYAYAGRLDDQVKVRGYRVELGEIEAALNQHEAVNQAVVAARADVYGVKRLIAYIKLDVAGTLPLASLRAHLEARLPDFMMPARFVTIDDFPRTPAGKIDRRALPEPASTRPDLETPYVAPGTPVEQAICAAIGELLEINPVGIDDSFFDLGGNSILALRLVNQLKQSQIEIPVALIFQYASARMLARQIAQGSLDTPEARLRHELNDQVMQTQQADDIAIVGMAGRFPGAPDVDAFWEVLSQGRETTAFFKPEELDTTIPEAIRLDPNFVPAHGQIPDADKFDAAFFGIPARQAAIMDPQHRIFLETAWHALENAGYGNAKGQNIGVFAGTHTNTYYIHNVRSRPDEMEKVGLTAAEMGNEKDFVATRVAYLLGLTGPALSIHTACSTSLVAVVQAFYALRNGQCRMAIAGGVSVAAQQFKGYLYQEGSMLSADGHCRPFDAKAAGTVFSDGAGAVVLKRLADALADGDTIHAVIKGAAFNNDGADKMSFSAPNIEGQARVVAMAQQVAHVDPRSITYIEAHGTATPLGDPIEVAALVQAFKARLPESEVVKQPWCVLGSVKSNFGHLTAAAGVTGLIKATLAMEHELIPATVHYSQPNPNIHLAGSPFTISGNHLPWRSEQGPRRAGVSSFGVGGTNAHVIIEQAPKTAQQTARSARPVQTVVLSAKTAVSLNVQTSQLVSWLKLHPDVDLADAAYTLQIGRSAFNHRRAVSAASVSNLIDVLTTQAQKTAAPVKPKKVVFMFPGQGAQSIHMAQALYESEAVFRQVVDQCQQILLARFNLDLISLLFPSEDGDKTVLSERLRDTAITQPALFTIEYALAQLWLSWGVEPHAMIGHSVGEFVAACLAGVFTLEDALYLVGLRGKLMSALPSGSMLSVRASQDKISHLLSQHHVELAAINGPQLCVVAGNQDDVAKFAEMLEQHGIVSKLLVTSHAFHSYMMEPMVAQLQDAVSKVTRHAPAIPILSTVTNLWLDEATAQDPQYWSQHARATVNFAGAVEKLWHDRSDGAQHLLLEVGPRQSLTVLARQQVKVPDQHIALASLSDPGNGDKALKALMDLDHLVVQTTLGQLWTHGIVIDWQAYQMGYKRYRIGLPGYAFERTRHWLTPGTPLGHTVKTTHQSNSDSSTLTAPLGEVRSMTTHTAQAEKHIPVLREIFEDLSGQELAGFDNQMSFLEMGLDSLLLTQIVRGINKQFGTGISFRQLQEGQASFGALAAWLQTQLPEAPAAEIQTPASATTQTLPTGAVIAPSVEYVAAQVQSIAPVASGSFVEQVIAQQMVLMNQQLALLRGAPVMSVATPSMVASSAVVPSMPAAAAAKSAVTVSESKSEEPAKPSVPFGAQARISLNRDALTPKQQAGLEKLIVEYNKKTAKSKVNAQQHRDYMSDPRVVTGFKPPTKEIVYPIVIERSKGSRLWDLDGNEYIDMLNGFGSTFFGHGAPFITEALHKQLDLGIEVGPQTPLAGEVAALFAEITNNERVAFCNTGSEAVLGAVRIARTVTGKDTIAIFNGSYHGIIDEVIIRGNKKLQSVPAASGIPFGNVQNMLVLDYGTPEALAILRERADEIAGVLVEPVQSRRCDYRPVEFWKELRKLTEETGMVLIFDEVITGLRSHPQGVQGRFGVKADVTTYGKVVGGGMSIGVVAGAKKFLDALDGGTWRFGDDSTPQAGVTYFAGTFVRHPLAMAAAKAVLMHLKEQGPSLQEKLNARGDQFAAEINAYFKEQNAPLLLKNFGSQMKLVFTEETPLQELFYHHMRLRGVHIWDFPCYLTTAHSEEDIAFVTRVFKESVRAMQADGFFPEATLNAAVEASEVVARISAGVKTNANQPPVPGARLGRAPDGTPAWFVPDPAKPGAYVRLADVTE
ncbi:amino acid adenylation domain-containing protein [Ampullimonas aquatilis]|uniref:amino acid adenylation domain-containing protein n=1 Tax=Ampullimonas aquatilis TaxID=1341549 RepID=UPI003C747AB3